MTDEDVKRDLERRMAGEIDRFVAELRRHLQLRAEQSVEMLLTSL